MMSTSAFWVAHQIRVGGSNFLKKFLSCYLATKGFKSSRNFIQKRTQCITSVKKTFHDFLGCLFCILCSLCLLMQLQRPSRGPCISRGLCSPYAYMAHSILKGFRFQTCLRKYHFVMWENQYSKAKGWIDFFLTLNDLEAKIFLNQ